MAYSNFIAAIDLGTSHIVGMIATKNPTGALTIIAYESVPSAKCIRRGCIYNVDEAAYQVKALVQKLNNKIPGERVDKVYVGIGGQSIRSVEHIVTRSMGVEGAVTSDIIQSMNKESEEYKPDMLDVLSIVSPTYYLDNRRESNPVGVSCSRIEARYKLIVARPSLRRNIIASIKDRAKIDIAGIFVSPLALADAVLFDGEKDLGCALVSFGAGVTTVSVYKHNELVSLNVIPLGTHLITRDIMTLNIVEPEAERIKKAYGSVIIDKEDESSIPINAIEGVGTRQVRVRDLNTVVEARMLEIIENVHARLEETGLMKALGAGMIVTGGGASLKNLDIVLKDKFELDIRMATVKKGVIEKSMLTVTEPEYVVIGLLLKGDLNCAYAKPTPPPIKVVPPVVIDEEAEDEPKGQEEPIENDSKQEASAPKETERSNSGRKGSFINKLASSFGRLFDEEEMGQQSEEDKTKKN